MLIGMASEETQDDSDKVAALIRQAEQALLDFDSNLYVSYDPTAELRKVCVELVITTTLFRSQLVLCQTLI